MYIYTFAVGPFYLPFVLFCLPFIPYSYRLYFYITVCVVFRIWGEIVCTFVHGVNGFILLSFRFFNILII